MGMLQCQHILEQPDRLHMQAAVNKTEDKMRNKKQSDHMEERLEDSEGNTG